jgi:hypothetical protein
VKKFAANYLVSETGKFLKNGILLAEEDGTVVEIIDTKGDLDEIAQLTFHNGILMSAYSFIRISADSFVLKPEHSISSLIHSFVAELRSISIQNLIEMGKQVQVQFPEMKIPEIINEIIPILLESKRFREEKIPGIFLLIGSDLIGMHFTAKSRLKKIL